MLPDDEQFLFFSILYDYLLVDKAFLKPKAFLFSFSLLTDPLMMTLKSNLN